MPFLVIGSLLTLFTGSLVGYATYQMLSLLDELTVYQLLFSDNATQSSISCNRSWEKAGLLELNKTDFSSLISASSNQILLKMLIVIVIYIVCLILAHTMFVWGSAKLLKNIRIGFVTELLSKPLQWYDVHSPSELSFHVTE